MMSQFISIPNQEVIWKSFQRIPQTKKIPLVELHKWFQTTMSIVYGSIQANRIQNVNQQQLLEYNREVVKMLMVHVKEYNNQLQPPSTPSTSLPPQPPSQTQPNPIQPVQSHYYDTLINNFTQGLEKLVQYPGKHSEYAIDKFWIHLQKRHRWYLIIPLTIIQKPDYSNIEKKNVNYNHLMLDLDKKQFIQKMTMNLI